MKTTRILVVDDEAAIRLSLKALLESEGFEAVIAENASEALERVKEGPFDLFLLDVLLPGMSGLDLLKELRRKINSRTPAIVMTGKPSPEVIEEGFASEMDHFVSKPIAFDSLLSLIRRLLIEAEALGDVYHGRDETLNVKPLAFFVHLVETHPLLPPRFLLVADASPLLEGEESEEKQALVNRSLFAFLNAFQQKLDPDRLECVVTTNGSDLLLSLFADLLEKKMIEERARAAREEVIRLLRLPDRNLSLKVIPFAPRSRNFLGRQVWSALRRAESISRISLSRLAFDPFLQGIYCADGQQLAGYELLMRPDHPQGTEKVYAALERLHLHSEVDARNIDAARKIAEKIPEHLLLSINISPESLLQRGFVPYLIHMMEIYTHRIILEFTERTPTLGDPEALLQLEVLRKNGFIIALDDVGSGFNNTITLLKVRPAIIKIDRLVIRGLATDPFRSEAVRSLVGMAQKISARTIAEGVETREEMEALRFLNVDYLQGYLLHKPQPYSTMNLTEEISLGERHDQSARAQ